MASSTANLAPGAGSDPVLSEADRGGIIVEQPPASAAVPLEDPPAPSLARANHGRRGRPRGVRRRLGLHPYWVERPAVHELLRAVLTDFGETPIR
jgi:hypothetical protein